jgi:uncharacterized protein YbgA (DUF1722 family)/uncharacterized protein YbbK (DUF523 family)
MKTQQGEARIILGVSSCLLGEKVRYNGDHKRDRYLTDVLSSYFDFRPFCPEVAIGLGVPRPTLRLEGAVNAPRAVIQDEGRRDVTKELARYGRDVAAATRDISGYIFKSRSPSCGMERVRVYDRNGSPSATGAGIYAGALMQARPLLPVEEEGRLNDADLRDNFLERVFVYARWQELNRGRVRVRDLVRFHTQHKFLIMSHDQETMRALGRLVAGAADDLPRAREDYITRLMRALKKPVSRSGQTNVLQHVAGFLRDGLDPADREELRVTIEEYRRGELPVIAPLTLIRHHLRRRPDDFLEQQYFLETRPAAIDTRRR